jgi:hypothetical protein
MLPSPFLSCFLHFLAEPRNLPPDPEHVNFGVLKMESNSSSNRILCSELTSVHSKEINDNYATA